jgi:hypothetical protein
MSWTLPDHTLEDVMKLWRKLVLGWIGALGDWLWVHLVTPLLPSLKQLTFKRVVYLAAFTLAFLAFAQLVSADIAFLWAGDTAFGFEVMSAVTFFVFRGYARLTVQMMGHQIRAATKRAAVLLRRYGGIVRQRRNANALRRRPGNPKRSDDEPAAWGQYAHA